MSGSSEIPYARPFWDQTEVAAIQEALASGWWTNGPTVARFEAALADRLAASHVVCVSSGTAALHVVLHALFPARGRRLLVTSSLNFSAAAACAALCGYDVALTDVDADALDMSPSSLEQILSRYGRRYDGIVVVPVHYAGTPAPMDRLVEVSHAHRALVVEDACHAIGGRYRGTDRPIGGSASSVAAVFSLHPNKPVAACEGGAVALHDAELAARLRAFRNHNMVQSDFVHPDEALEGGTRNPWYYEIREPGLNYRLSDLHAAVGLAQLARLPASLGARQSMASRYRAAFEGSSSIRPVPLRHVPESALHLFPVVFDLARLRRTKRAVFEHFASAGVRLQMHYVPLHRQPAYERLPLVAESSFPVLDSLAPGLASLPLFYGMTEAQQDVVLRAAAALGV